MKLQMKIMLVVILMILTTNTVSCSANNVKVQPMETTTPNGIISYNITAVPTIFAKSLQTTPVVKLNWAYADSQHLKFNITVTGLDANINVEDFVCDPYIVTKEAIQYSRPGREDVKHLTDQPGNPLEITYGSVLNPPIQYKSLDIDMDVTIGPCGDYLNFQESNVTPTVIPDLIGNYHFSFQVPVQ